MNNHERTIYVSSKWVFVRDMKHLESYGDIDKIIELMNRVNKSDNCAVDILKKEIKEQDDEKVIIALEKILKKIYSS